MAEGIRTSTDERVVVNKDFSLIVPEGYLYSTEAGGAVGTRALTFIKTEQNEYFNNNMGEYMEFDLDGPFAAPRCCTVAHMRGLDGGLDLSASETRQAVRAMFGQMASMFGGVCTAVMEKDDLLVYFSKFQGRETNTHFMLVTPQNMYSGQIWLNDVRTQKEREQIAKEWLRTAEKYQMTDADKVPRKPFVAPTYHEKKRERIAVLTVAVPDQLKTLQDEWNTADALSAHRLKGEYAFLAVNADFAKRLDSYREAEWMIKAPHAGVNEWPALASLWGEEKKVERKTALTNIFKNNLEDHSFKIHIKDLGERLTVGYTQVFESTDPIEQFADFFLIFFADTRVIQVNIRIATILDVPAMEKAIGAWAATAQLASAEEAQTYQQEKDARELGNFAGPNGKIDAILACQLFTNDVFFFVQGQIRAEGRHHSLHGLQLNAEALGQYPHLREKYGVLGRALTDLLNFVEEDEHLVLDEECVHYEYDNLNNIDPMQINGATIVPTEMPEIGKGLSGIRVFLLMAWHMILITRNEEGRYVAVLDQNLYRGIPDAEAYVCQLIKRLRAYNGIEGEFEVVFASAVNTMGGIENYLEEENPLRCEQNIDMQPTQVAGDQEPYAAVVQQIAAAKQAGVWDQWNRGHRAGKSAPKKRATTPKKTAEKPQEKPTAKAADTKTSAKETKAEKRRSDTEKVKKPQAPRQTSEEYKKKKMERVEAECRAKVQEFQAALDAEIRRRMEAYVEQMHQHRNDLRQQISVHQQRLSQLGFFAFSEKKAEKAAIQELEAQLETPIGVFSSAEEKRLKKLADTAHTRYALQVDKYLYARFPGLKPQSDKYKFGRTNAENSDTLYRLMSQKPDQKYTMIDIQAMCLEHGIDESESYLNALVKKLRDAGRVIRSVDRGVAYFQVVGAVNPSIKKPPEPVEYDFSTFSSVDELHWVMSQEPGQKYTVDDIQAMYLKRGKDYSASYLVAIMHRLKATGRVTRSEDGGIAYFQVVEPFKPRPEHIKKPPIKKRPPNYNETPEYAKVPCPEPPSMTVVFGS